MMLTSIVTDDDNDDDTAHDREKAHCADEETRTAAGRSGGDRSGRSNFFGKIISALSGRVRKTVETGNRWTVRSHRTLINTPEELLNFVYAESMINEIPEHFTLAGEIIIVLKGKADCKVYLIGTNHISGNSVLAVNLLLEQVKPHIVVTELDRSRAGLDASSVIFSGSPYTFNYKFLRTAGTEFGLIGGVIFFMLAFLETFVGRLLNVNWGADLRSPFLVIRTAMELMPRDQTGGRPYEILLGDRPIEVTFRRMGLSLNSFQKAHSLMTVLISIFFGLKCSMLVTAARLNKNPRFEHVLVHERDIYLTHSLQEAANMTFAEPTRVVGIVGKDHVPGIMRMWGKVTSADIDEVMITS